MVSLWYKHIIYITFSRVCVRGRSDSWPFIVFRRICDCGFWTAVCFGCYLLPLNCNIWPRTYLIVMARQIFKLDIASFYVALKCKLCYLAVCTIHKNKIALPLSLGIWFLFCRPYKIEDLFSFSYFFTMI